MLVMNNQKCTVHIGSMLLLPGSNVVPDGAIDRKHPIIKALENQGKLSFMEKITPSVAEIAISKANTQKVVDEIEGCVKKTSAGVKKAAVARKMELDEFDVQWDEAKQKEMNEKMEAKKQNDSASNN